MRITNRLHIWSNKKCKNNSFFIFQAQFTHLMDGSNSAILVHWDTAAFLLQTNTLVERTIETLYTIVRICNLIRRNIIRLYKSAVFKDALIIIKFANSYIYLFWIDTLSHLYSVYQTIYRKYAIIIHKENTF